MAENWLKEHKEILEKRFNLELVDDRRGDRNSAIKELSQPLVIITKVRRDNTWFEYHGFSNMEQALDTILQDMTDMLYCSGGDADAYHLITSTRAILVCLFKGKVVKLFPRTDGVAFLVESEENVFDTLAGFIPAINLEITDHERQTSEETETTGPGHNEGQEEPSQLLDPPQTEHNEAEEHNSEA